jgi:hypothetical protein
LRFPRIGEDVPDHRTRVRTADAALHDGIEIAQFEVDRLESQAGE